MNKEDKLSFDFLKYSVACVLTHRYPNNKQTNKLTKSNKNIGCWNHEYTVTVDAYTRSISKEKEGGGNS